MGYRIVYGRVKKLRRMDSRIAPRAALTALCFLLFCILVSAFWPEGTEVLRNLLLPGDPVVTAAALEDLSGELRAGASVGEALKHFCLRILEGAELGSVR